MSVIVFQNLATELVEGMMAVYKCKWDCELKSIYDHFRFTILCYHFLQNSKGSHIHLYVNGQARSQRLDSELVVSEGVKDGWV